MIVARRVEYQRTTSWIGMKVDGVTLVERFITCMQKERSAVAFHMFTNGTVEEQLELNFTERFVWTQKALEDMPWPDTFVNGSQPMFRYWHKTYKL